MKAVVYGGGVIGRGYVGAIFALSGYQVTFVDVVDSVVAVVNERGEYPVCFLMPDQDEERMITGVRAVHGREADAVARAIADADIMATAVGANALPYIAANIVAGLALRAREGRPPLNIILCENLMDANRVFERLLMESAGARAWADLRPRVGIVEACIGTTVPIQTPEMLKASPLRLCMERHVPLLVDKAGFLGDIPPVQNMVCFDQFDFYVRRKLYIHNMGHAVCAYLGLYAGNGYIHEAILDPDIRIICQSAMTEVALSLARAYGRDAGELYDYAIDLLVRFENEKIQVTCARVGADPVRKLQRDDRLVGAALFCLENGVQPDAIYLGIAAALLQYLIEKEQPHTEENARAALAALAGSDACRALEHNVFPLFRAFLRGDRVSALRRAAERDRLRDGKPIV